MRQLRNRHARRHLDLVEIERLVEIHARQIELEELGQIVRQAHDFHVRHVVRDDAALRLDARSSRLALEVDRQVQADLLVLDHPLQVHVHHGIARRMHLHVLDDDRLLLRVDIDADDRGIEFLVVISVSSF